MEKLEKDLDTVESKIRWIDLTADFRTDAKQSNKRMFIICWVMAAIIAFMAGAGLYFFDRAQDKHLAQVESLTLKMENQQKEFLAFLNSYDFASYQQEGDGLNNIANNTTQGDVTYEPAGEVSDTERP